MFRVQLFYRSLKKGAEAMGGAVENQKRVTMGGLNLIPHHNRTVTDAGLGLIVCFLKIISAVKCLNRKW